MAEINTDKYKLNINLKQKEDNKFFYAFSLLFILI